MKIITVKSLSHPEVRRLSSREPSPSAAIEQTVKGILRDVRADGHEAVMRYAGQFDGLKGTLAAGKSEIEKTASRVSPAVRRALKKSIANVKRFHEKQREKSWFFKGRDGETLGQTIRPLARVGLYVPGGAGSYPSTLVMTAVPAQVAGVQSIAVVTPAPRGIQPAVACALQELGLEEVYKVGGAQAVGMLAYGTSKVARVDKIVGPGNVFATLAKREVFGTVDIDMIAGPSEILILADESADADWVAADLLSQAEHGSGYEAAICITTSRQFAAWVSECVTQQAATSPRKDLVEKCLALYGRILVVPDWDLGCLLADSIAPEHIEVMTSDAAALARRVRNAGAVFVGGSSSEPVGDYFAGPNHVLPTNGSARFFSPLGTYDFYKRSSWIQYTPKAMQKNGADIATLADEEGFHHHAMAVRKRL